MLLLLHLSPPHCCRYVKGDVEWDSVAIVKYPFICGFAGFSAGLFGVGGGIVKGPLMLEMGVLPLVRIGLEHSLPECMLLTLTLTRTPIL